MSPHLARNRLARIPQFFCAFAHPPIDWSVPPLGPKSPCANSAVFLCFRAPPNRLECPPLGPKSPCANSAFFLCFRAPPNRLECSPHLARNPCANSAVFFVFSRTPQSAGVSPHLARNRLARIPQFFCVFAHPPIGWSVPPLGPKSHCANSAVFFVFSRTPQSAGVSPHLARNRLARIPQLIFLCFRAPPNRLECPPTWPEIALREFRSFFVFSRTPQLAGVSPHLARNRIARIPQFFCDPPIGWSVPPLGPKSPCANSAVFLCFRAPPNRLECPPTWPRNRLARIPQFFCVFAHPPIDWSVPPLGPKSPCANSAVFLCCRAPPNRLECPPTWPEIALREFRSFFVFLRTPQSTGVPPTWPEIALREFRNFLCFRAPPNRLECPPTWPEIALHEFRSFFVFSRTPQSARVSPHLARNRLARIPQVFLCFRAPPNRLECPPTWPEIALREFRSFFVFSRTPQSAGVSPHLARNRLARIPQFFCVFAHPPIDWTPTWPEIALREFRSFFVFSRTPQLTGVSPHFGLKSPCANSAVFLCFCAPPKRLECPPTWPEIALREFCRFLCFCAPLHPQPPAAARRRPTATPRRRPAATPRRRAAVPPRCSHRAVHSADSWHAAGERSLRGDYAVTMRSLRSCAAKFSTAITRATTQTTKR